jgi:hypothetical protein
MAREFLCGSVENTTFSPQAPGTGVRERRSCCPGGFGTRGHWRGRAKQGSSHATSGEAKGATHASHGWPRMVTQGLRAAGSAERNGDPGLQRCRIASRRKSFPQPPGSTCIRAVSTSLCFATRLSQIVFSAIGERRYLGPTSDLISERRSPCAKRYSHEQTLQPHRRKRYKEMLTISGPAG